MNKTELKLEDYCDGCAFIEPEALRYTSPTGDCIIDIKCKHRGVCNRLHANLKKFMEAENVRSEE